MICLTFSNLSLFGEYLTNTGTRPDGIVAAGERFAHGGGSDMEFEAERNTKTQLMALLMTIAVVGGAIAYALTA